MGSGCFVCLKSWRLRLKPPITSKPVHGTRWNLIAWYAYDWANSAYTTLLITVFVVYIQRVVFLDQGAMGAVVWAWSIAMSMLIGGIVSPFAGALADGFGCKRLGLALSVSCGGFCCITIGCIPQSATWMIVLFLVLANLGLELSLTFYNGFLPEIADETEFNQVSSRGFAAGYIGGGLALLAAMLFLSFNQSLELDDRLRICIVCTGVWWILFSIPAICILKDKKEEAAPESYSGRCRNSIQETLATLSELRLSPNLFWFLIGFLIYNDGIQTVISQSSTFALQELKFDDSELVSVVLMIQFIATPGAILVAWLADRHTRKTALLVCLGAWNCLLFSAWFVHEKWQFWVLAAGVAVVLGGTQSVSRAIMSSLTPSGSEARYFGFFNLSGKATSFLGTFFFGAIVASTGSSRLAIAGLLLFFVVGMSIIWSRVKISKSSEEVIRSNEKIQS